MLLASAPRVLAGDHSSTKRAYWLPKLARNAARDKAERDALIALGWRVLVVWECACRASQREALQAAMTAFIRSAPGESHAFAEIGRAELEPPKNRGR